MKKLKLPKLADKKYKSKSFREPGLFWHFHHATLVEYSSEAFTRFDEIYNCKWKGEHNLRFKLFNRVKLTGLPAHVKMLLADCAKKFKAWKQKGNGKTYGTFDLSRSALNAWLYSHKPLMEELHRKQCKGCTWDGNTIFTGKYKHLDH